MRRFREHIDPITSGVPSDAELECAAAWNQAGRRGQIAAHHYYLINDDQGMGGIYFYIHPRRASCLPKGKVLASGEVPHNEDLSHGIFAIKGKHVNSEWQQVVGGGDGLPIVLNDAT